MAAEGVFFHSSSDRDVGPPAGGEREPLDVIYVLQRTSAKIYSSENTIKDPEQTSSHIQDYLIP